MPVICAAWGFGNQEILLLLLLIAAIIILPRLLHPDPRVRERGFAMLAGGVLTVMALLIYRGNL